MEKFEKIKSYCKVLGLIGIPTEEDLKKARNKLLKKWHPDKVERQASEVRKEANQKTKKINEAYEYLNGQDLRQFLKSEWTSSKTNTYSWKSKKQQEPPPYWETPWESEKQQEPSPYRETPKKM